ncbi:MAG: 30S ribosomal protein S8 [Gammaproteobacteria bacterium]|nr:30S ribosomal protein S8 [Gammaproteobacteria bacterium]MDD9824967.1 30S ribosomal protein S8 [Gammaproteobacteria bacterium]MDD9863624.1 30S ribosomal protein S8 [Gammaproteobacteria bacterium]
MAVQDPVADMLCRIKNAQARFKPEVRVPASGHKREIAELLQREGYVEDVALEGDAMKTIVIRLKYYKGAPVIEMMRRESKLSRRVYRKSRDLPTVRRGLGIAVISTPQGVMTDREAREKGLGGEVVCLVA